MPCNSDYLEPTQKERNKKEVSGFIVFVDKELGIETPQDIVNASKHIYGSPVDLDVVVEILCTKLSSLNLEQEEKIIYNARNAKSRELANWWEEHLEADRKRLQKEIDEAENEAAIKSALEKLTPHERRVLGL